MARVFISYRRDDSGGYTQAIFDDLTDRFGRGQVFKDHVAIPGGADFITTIERAIERADAVVVVIGPEWLTCKDAAGHRRLDNPDDPIVFEVSAALRRDAPIFPILVGAARMPRPSDLPEPIRALTRHNAIELSDARWDYDVARLADAIEAALPRSARWRGRLAHRRWPLLATAVTGIVVAAGIMVAWPFLPTSSAPLASTPVADPMSGSLNIAVADFGRLDDAGGASQWDWASRLASGVHKDLDAQLQPLSTRDHLGIETRGPRDTGSIDGETPRERRKEAEALARRLRADVVVYGNLHVAGGKTVFLPEFYLSPRILDDAEELVGHYELGASLDESGDIEKNLATFGELQTALSARSQGLAQFVVGLHYLNVDRLDEAARYFAAADATQGWEEARGKEVFQLFLGHSAGRLGNLDDAEASYRRAIDANPAYPRARLGLAEVAFQRAKGTCEQGQIDEPGLRKALAGFQSALEVADRLLVPNVPTKVAWFKGRVLMCLSQAGVGDWGEAERAFRQVLDEYAAGNEDVRELAADSHASLAFVYWPSEGDREADAKYRKAADELAEASSLTARDQRRGEYQGYAGLALERSRQYDRADEAYATALKLDRNADRQAAYTQARERVRALRASG